MDRNLVVDKSMRVVRHEWLRTLLIVLVFVFAFLPLLTMIVKISPSDLSYVFKDRNFWLSIKNSILYSLIATVITLVIALVAAYLLNTSSIKKKNIFVILLTIGMLVPTLSIGLGVRTLLGRNGYLDHILGIKIRSVGMPALIFGSIIASFPITFLLLYDALKYEDKGIYDTANILGISRISTFFKLTIPYLKLPLISAFFASFSWIFSDYGIPMELSGKTHTLAMYLYSAINASASYGRGSIAGIFLLMPTLLSFVFDIIFKDHSTNDKNSRLIKADKSFNIITIAVLSVVTIFLFIPQLSFIALAFTKAFPNDMSFTLDNLSNMFKTSYFKPMEALSNSLIIAVSTGIIGTILAYLLGYLTVRHSGTMGKVVNLLTISTIAIPGLVLGIGYVVLFKDTRGFFYNTIFILIAVNVFHFLGSPFVMAKNCLSKINSDYEVVGETLGISKAKIFFKVLLPNSITTLLEMFSYFFLNSMITISAVIFLCSYANQPLSVLINMYEKHSNYEMQAAVSVVIFSINIIFRVILGIVSFYIKKYQKKTK